MNPTPPPAGRGAGKAERSGRRAAERGASLIVVMLILIIVSILGVGGAQIALMAERGARNDRDMQVAWQSAETALMDAERDIHDPASSRAAIFSEMSNATAFVADCGTTGSSKGLCALAATGKPAWLTVDFTVSEGSGTPRTTGFGDFTSRGFRAGPAGVQPAARPRYIIEPLPDPGNRDLAGSASYLYRVTAMGFGPREDIQAVAQIIYRN